MDALFGEMLDALGRGENVVLCTVLASSGSTPRGAGSRMAVFADGHTAGTVGGGSVELLAIAQASAVFRSGVPVLRGYALSKSEVADIGMICGGNVTIYFQLFLHTDAAARQLLECLRTLVLENTNAWLVARIDGGVMTETAVYDEENGLRFAATLKEQDVLPLLSSDAVLTAGEPMLYTEPISARGTVYVFGGGHVGRELAPLLHHVGFRVVVYDDRAALANRAAFPGAVGVLCGAYEAFPDQITLTADDYVVVMTPGHQADYTVLSRALRSPVTYIGCIGSRGKVAAVNKRLMADGIPAADIARVHAPIGIPIGGKTPAEIAVSIAAELILHRSRLRKGNH